MNQELKIELIYWMKTRPYSNKLRKDCNRYFECTYDICIFALEAFAIDMGYRNFTQKKKLSRFFLDHITPILIRNKITMIQFQFIRDTDNDIYLIYELDKYNPVFAYIKNELQPKN